MILRILLRRVICLGVAGLIGSVVAADQPPRQPEVLVVADAGGPPAALRPSPDKPVHFVIIGGEVRNLGEQLPHLKLFGGDEVARELRKVLASQGFVEARPGGPKPQIAILYAWGSANLDWLPPEDYMGPIEDTGGLPEPEPSNVYFNKHEIDRLIGSRKAERRLMAWWDAEKLHEAFINDRIYVEVAALDLAAAARKERKLLWRTRISLDWRDLKPDSLGLMLTSAAPYFGLATDRGVFVDDNLRKRAEVEVGEATVVEEDAKLPERK